jgi:asparagine synthase (glutamine-hydrolysing)
VCGIAGILRITTPLPGQVDASQAAASPPAIPARWLARLHEGIAHRGPDASGTFFDSASRVDRSGQTQHVQVALTHARLSIIDHEGGAQPMVRSAHQQASDRLALVFNGCIYNHRELRDRLTRAGARFTTDHSDTEAIMHAYVAHGPALADHLDGMFALAIWDGPRAQLLVARDRAREKPLFFARLELEHRGLRTELAWFASTARAVIELGRLLRAELTGTRDSNTPSPGTPGAGALRVPVVPLARWLRFGADDQALSPVDGHTGPLVESWPVRGVLASIEAPAASFPGPSPLPVRSSPLTAAEVDELLAASVRQRLDADVPLGCLLSGGLDSGLVASHAQRALGALGSGPLKTFTVRVPGAGFDESQIAAHVARHLSAQHHTLECQPTAAADLVALIHQLGQPLGDSSLLPTYWVCRAVRAHVKVALTGDGGDELFGGYDRHVAALMLGPGAGLRGSIARALIGALEPALIADLRGLVGRSGRLAKALDRLDRLHAGVAQGYDELRAQTPMTILRQLLPALALASSTDPSLRGAGIELDPAAADPLAHDFDHYMGPDVLCKTDTASMAQGVGLELRAPMLASALVFTARAMPLGVLMPPRRTLWGPVPSRKGLLRQVASGHLPADVLSLPKRGFSVPIGAWFRDDFGGLGTLLRDRLLGPEPFGPDGLGLAPLISTRAVVGLVDEHLGTGRAGRRLPTRDHGQRLFGLLSLSIWAQSLARPYAGLLGNGSETQAHAPRVPMDSP